MRHVIDRVVSNKQFVCALIVINSPLYSIEYRRWYSVHGKVIVAFGGAKHISQDEKFPFLVFVMSNLRD